jgi:hypothetical protein
VIWAGENILVDGHNRYEICTKHNIPFEVKKMDFDDDNAVKSWIINNQLSRRNLKPDAISILRGMEYNLTKKDASGRSDREFSEGKNCTPKNTAAELAEKHGVSERTIKNDGKFAEAVQTLKNKINVDLKEQIDSGEAPAKFKIIEAAKVAEESPEKAKEILTEKKEVKGKRDPLDDTKDVEEESEILWNLKKNWKKADKTDKQKFMEWIK